MSVASRISDFAAGLAERSHRHTAVLQAELQQIEARKAQVEGELDAANLAGKRFADFQVSIGDNYQCPRCWIYSGVNASLRPIPTDSGDDAFRCNACFDVFI